METLSGNLKNVVEGARIIRVHNNTPAMVGAGCSVFSTGEGTTIFKRFFYPLGKKIFQNLIFFIALQGKFVSYS